MADFITNNPNPQAAWINTANQILQLAETIQEGDVKASLVKAAGSLSSIAMRPELNNARFQQELEKLNITIQAKAASQDATFADKTAARAMNLQLAAMKGDQRQTELEMKGLQQMSVLEQKQAGDLKKVRESKGLDIEREKLKQSGATDAFMLKSMDRADQATVGDKRKVEWYYRERASEKLDELDKLARSQAEERQLIENATKSAIFGPKDTVIRLAEERVKTMSPAAQEEFGRVMRLANKAVNAKIDRTLAIPEYRDAARRLGIDFASEEMMAQLRDVTEREQSPVRFVEKTIAQAEAAASTNAKGEKLYWELTGAMKKHGVAQQVINAQMEKLAAEGRVVIPKQDPKMLEASLLQEGAAATRKGKLMKGAKGVGAAIALAYIGSKFMGGGDDKAVDPQLQMMLMQQMAQRGGGGGGEDDAQMQGKELMNLSRALNILKTMQQMQGANMEAPVSMARLI